MKNKYLIGLLLVLFFRVEFYAQQNVLITDGNATTPAASSLLELNSTTKGFLVPRVSLSSITDVSTIASPATSLLVYNINSSITNGSGVGFYHWNGTSWQKFDTGNNVGDWKIKGNTSLVSPASPTTYGASTIGTSENWIGTTDAVDFVVGTNQIERLRIMNTTGNVAIGNSAPGNNILNVSTTAAASGNGRGISLTAQAAGTEGNGGSISLNAGLGGAPTSSSGYGLGGSINLLAGLGASSGSYGTTGGSITLAARGSNYCNGCGLSAGHVNIYSGGPISGATLTTGNINFYSNYDSPTQRMIIRGLSGHVGIGTTSPTKRLHVVNDIDADGVAAIDNATPGGFAGIYFYQSGSSNYRGHVGYVNTGGTSTFGGKGAFQIASGNRPIIFSATNGTETYNEVARFDNINSSFILNTANLDYDIIGDNSAGEPTWRPSAPDWGYLGTSSNYWFRVYANNYYYSGTSGGSWTSFDTYDDLKLLNDIKMDYYWDDKLNNHVAVINPKTIPKCILSDDKNEDEVFIDVKKLDGLFIGSLRQLDFETKLRDKKIIGKLNEIIASDEDKILSDFGSASGNKSEIIVYFSDEFANNNDGVNYNIQITPTSPHKYYYLKEKHKNYFVVSVESMGIFTFDWLVNIKNENNQKINHEEDVFAPTGWGKVEGDYPNINTLPKKKP
jgi:hypothetical protein